MKKRNIILIAFGIIMFLGFILSNEESENNIKKDKNISIPKEIIIYERLEAQISVLEIINESGNFDKNQRHIKFLIDETINLIEESKKYDVDSINQKNKELSDLFSKIIK